ncbi:hypothetical protein KUW15_02950 [Qipengyuania aquimaris]|uniref:DUF2306 domain-containing protein n=1 Tax=Qipengyuania aquimaris TaxID=255984 RepID=UPI001C968ABD|nr:hypothetical protein [Qipengyuania aquimaris]MBY6127668.1 hypothetical protein [Qipengyuania aquimaris]
MTALSLPNHLFRRSGPMDITPITRALVIGVGGAMTAVCIFAIARALLGFTPDLPHLSNVAVAFHVTTVLPCVPLGVYLLLARKGTPRHKQLGKLWIVLMVITATSTLFIHDGMRLSWIHIFVPITYRAAWLIVSSARKGDLVTHRKEIIGLFFGALMIPGIAAIALPGRLMNVMLFG